LEKLALYIESLIFASEQAVSQADMSSTLKDSFEVSVKEAEIEKALEELIQKYSSEDYSMEIVAINGGYQFMSKGAYHHVIGTLLKLQSNKKLSRTALETLSIVAYKQPVSKTDIELIRGVNCDYTIQKLLEKELVEIIGRAEGPGRPLLYGTSEKFMNYFGIKSIKDLPKLRDLEGEKPEETVGEEQPIETFKTVINIKED
jgi:segregation and condensation protein B